jgi:hypothetical protein
MNLKLSLVPRNGLCLSLIAMTVLATGCANSRRPGSYDGDLQSEQSDSFVQDNAVGGAATGAVIGCVAGTILDVLLAVATHGRASPGIGCAAGAAAGAVAGGVDGYTQGEQAQAQATHVVMTRSVTADIEKENAKLQTALQTAERVVDTDQKQLDQIKSELAAKSISLEDARAQTAAIRENTAQIVAILDTARKKRDDFLAARGQLLGNDTAVVDREIAVLNGQIARLETQLASVNASLTLTGLN